MPRSIGVLFGGPSAEHDISLRSAAAVTGALSEGGCTVYPIYISQKEEYFLLANAEAVLAAPFVFSPERLSPITGGFLRTDGTLLTPSVLFPVLHGDFGEDGRLQAVLDAVGLPYVGCRRAASEIAIDKARTKDTVRAAGVSVLPHIVLTSPDFTAAAALGLPFFLKPVSGGSSFGAGAVHNEAEFAARFTEALRYSPRVICEPYIIKGKEIEVAVMETSPGVLLSAVGEVEPSEEFYSYFDKYEKGKARLSFAEGLPERERTAVCDMARRAFRAVGCRGLARVDFFRTADGNFYLNEINTMPGMTSDSLYPRLVQRELGVTAPALFLLLAEGAYLP